MNIAILQILPLNTAAHWFAVSADVSRVCDIVYKEERSWSGVNRTVIKIYSAKPYQFEPTYIPIYPPREEPLQKEERGTSILHHKFQKHPLTPQFCTTVLGPRFAPQFFFLNHEEQHTKNKSHTFKIYLKIHNFLGKFSFKSSFKSAEWPSSFYGLW